MTPYRLKTRVPISSTPPIHRLTNSRPGKLSPPRASTLRLDRDPSSLVPWEHSASRWTREGVAWRMVTCCLMSTACARKEGDFLRAGGTTRRAAPEYKDRNICRYLSWKGQRSVGQHSEQCHQDAQRTLSSSSARSVQCSSEEHGWL